VFIPYTSLAARVLQFEVESYDDKIVRQVYRPR